MTQEEKKAWNNASTARAELQEADEAWALGDQEKAQLHFGAAWNLMKQAKRHLLNVQTERILGTRA